MTKPLKVQGGTAWHTSSSIGGLNWRKKIKEEAEEEVRSSSLTRLALSTFMLAKSYRVPLKEWRLRGDIRLDDDLEDEDLENFEVSGDGEEGWRSFRPHSRYFSCQLPNVCREDLIIEDPLRVESRTWWLHGEFILL